MNRAFLELGEFSEETLLHFNPLVGGLAASPIDIAAVRKNSTYWRRSLIDSVAAISPAIAAAVP